MTSQAPWRRVKAIRSKSSGLELELTCGHAYPRPHGTIASKRMQCERCAVEPEPVRLSDVQAVLLDDIALTPQTAAPNYRPLRTLVEHGFVAVVDPRLAAPKYAITPAGEAWRAERLRRAS